MRTLETEVPMKGVRPVEINLKVRNVAEGIRFYETALAVRFVEDRHGEGPVHHHVQFGTWPSESFFLFNVQEGSERSSCGFLVDDLDAVHRRALGAGAKELAPPMETPGMPRNSGIEDPSQYVKAGWQHPDEDHALKSVRCDSRDSPCSMNDYANFLHKLRDVSPDMDAALDLALDRSLSREGHRLLGRDNIDGFTFEVLREEPEPVVLISNKKGSARFLLKPSVLKPAIELVGNMGLGNDDLEAASGLIGNNVEALHDLWEWHRFWHAIEGAT